MIKKSHVKWTLILILLSIWVFPQASEAQNAVFKRLKKKFDSGEIFKANLVNQFIDSYTSDTVTTNGQIWIGLNRYKIMMKDRYILVNDMISKVYNGIKNQLIISKYDPQEDDYAPSRFLSGSEKEYRIEDKKIDHYGYMIEMHSNDPFSLFKRIDIEVTDKLIPIYIKAIDQTNNITISRFDSGSFVKPTKKMFTISYPKNAQIIDLRK